MLILALLALFAGPLLYHWIRRGGLIARTFDRLVVAALVLLLAFSLAPEALAGIGPAALVLMAAGYLVPGVLESGIKSAARAFHFIGMLLAVLGLALHALLDGAGLAGSELTVASDLAAAIVLHRLGVGLALWLMIQPAFGHRAAVVVLVLVSAVTVAGFSLSEKILPLAGGNAVLVVQSLIIGAITHSLVHRGHAQGGGVSS